MKVAVIGGVTSTSLLIDKLSKHGFDNVEVFGYMPEKVDLVSGWTNLQPVATRAGYRFSPFVHVSECLDALLDLNPQWLFAVGLSQLIPDEILSIPIQGSIGFHPTALPLGRGRAPIAWLVLEQQNGAATFFILKNGIDDGPILTQVPFEVTIDDDAQSVEKKVLEAEAIALDILLPKLLIGDVQAIEQDHSQATFFCRRAPEDGWIDWYQSSETLIKLVRASTTPHPGAYTYCKDVKIDILSAIQKELSTEKGVVGRILRVMPDSSFIVQCGQGHLLVVRWQSDTNWLPRVGKRLGYYTESEIFSLRQRMINMEEQIAELKRLIKK